MLTFLETRVTLNSKWFTAWRKFTFELAPSITDLDAYISHHKLNGVVLLVFFLFSKPNTQGENARRKETGAWVSRGESGVYGRGMKTYSTYYTVHRLCGF